MRTAVPLRALAALLVALWPLAAAGALPPPAPPHDGEACEACHPGDPAAPVECGTCHGPDANLHPDGVPPSQPVPPAFPLEDGRLTCRSCHRLHGPAGPHALRGFDDPGVQSLSDFCALCHGGGLARTNPHRADAGENRCAFCHASVRPGAVLAGVRLTARVDANRLCDFCHDVRAKDHPRNIDPVLDLPDELPRGPGGEITCATCHNPHGSSRFTHFLREAYGLHFERGLQENPHQNDRYACRGCHVEAAPERITKARHDLRFQGDAILLCVSCHVTARSHHPVGVPLPPEMAARLRDAGALPLDPEGRTTCITCHTNNCETGAQHMSVRRYDPKRFRLDLCWGCHEKEKFAATDPHRKTVDDTTEGCVFCHDRPPVKGLERAEDLYFVSQVKMICLRCHEDLSDQDVSHMGKPPPDWMLERLRQAAEARATEFPLERDGTLTCTTCHNAHFSAKDDRHKTRLPSRDMCALCHSR
ncbi:MAG: hypothetical protein Kow0054_27750 [Deferrisoma sp.]